MIPVAAAIAQMAGSGPSPANGKHLIATWIVGLWFPTVSMVVLIVAQAKRPDALRKRSQWVVLAVLGLVTASHFYNPFHLMRAVLLLSAVVAVAGVFGFGRLYPAPSLAALAFLGVFMFRLLLRTLWLAYNYRNNSFSGRTGLSEMVLQDTLYFGVITVGWIAAVWHSRSVYSDRARR